MRKLVYGILIAVFFLIFVFQDNYSWIPLQDYWQVLISSFSPGGLGDRLALVALSVTLSLGILGFALALLGISLSRSSVSFAAFIRFVSPIYELQSMAVILSVILVLSVASTYLRYTNVIDIWLKISLIPFLDFLLLTIKSSLFLEKKEFMRNRLLKLVEKKYAHVAEYFLNVPLRAFPENAFEMLYEILLIAIQKPGLSEFCYQTNRKIIDATRTE